MGKASVGSLLPFSHREEEITRVSENPIIMSENTSNKSISPQNNVKGQQMFLSPR